MLIISVCSVGSPCRHSMLSGWTSANYCTLPECFTLHIAHVHATIANDRLANHATITHVKSLLSILKHVEADIRGMPKWYWRAVSTAPCDCQAAGHSALEVSQLDACPSQRPSAAWNVFLAQR